jgi:hypothetical protein
MLAVAQALCECFIWNHENSELPRWHGFDKAPRLIARLDAFPAQEREVPELTNLTSTETQSGNNAHDGEMK